MRFRKECVLRKNCCLQNEAFLKCNIFFVAISRLSEIAQTMAFEELDPLYHFSTHYRDRLNIVDQCFTAKGSPDKKSSSSRLSRRKNNPRYKTQPITFDEIKEVEEPSTPSNENNNVSPANSFLTNLHLENTNVTAEERLQPHPETVKNEVISNEGRGSGGSENIWYDSPYPSKLSFLDVPENVSPYHHHQHHSNKKQSEKAKLKNRAMRRRNNPRYKTQPITFDEIKEVEEPENGEQSESSSTAVAPSPTIDVLINSHKTPSDQNQTLIMGYAR